MRRYDMLVPAPEPALHTVSTHRQQVWLAVWTYTTPHHGRPRLHKAFRQFHFPAVPTPQTNLERNQRSLEQHRHSLDDAAGPGLDLVHVAEIGADCLIWAGAPRSNHPLPRSRALPLSAVPTRSD